MSICDYFAGPWEWLHTLGRTDGESERPPTHLHPAYRMAFRRARHRRNLRAGARVRHVHIPLSDRKDDE